MLKFELTIYVLLVEHYMVQQAVKNANNTGFIADFNKHFGDIAGKLAVVVNDEATKEVTELCTLSITIPADKNARELIHFLAVTEEEYKKAFNLSFFAYKLKQIEGDEPNKSLLLD